MKKNSANIKGFAMTELLAVSIVILLIFTVLVSNYLPILAEYENRTSFTNVTSDYAAFYIRKLYKSVLENATSYNNLEVSLKSPNPAYRQIYKEGTGLSNTLLSSSDNARLSQIIKTYEIEEIILTSYKLTEAKKSYKKSSGVLYDYIKYLPNYTRALYGSNNQMKDPFRIILKTKSYGYATTQIMPDPPTPYTCFTYDWDSTNNYLVIKKYNPQAAAECQENKENVVIDGSTITVPTTNAGNKSGQVGRIGDEAFYNIPGNVKIKSIDLEKNVTQIGNRAFKGNNITVLHIANQMPGVVKIGDYAFEGNQLTQIMIPDRSGTNQEIGLGEGIFANNYTLQAIKFDFNDYSKRTVITTKMFALDDDSNTDNQISKRKELNIVIPENVRSIQASAFKNLKIASLTFEGTIQSYIEDEDHPENETVLNGDKLSVLNDIGAFAFGSDDNLLKNDKKYIDVTIPKNVTVIGENAFRNVKIGELNFEDRPDLNFPSQLGTISAGTFSIKTGTEGVEAMQGVINQICEDYKNDEDYAEIYYEGTGENKTCIYQNVRGVKFPTSLKTIADHAFQNQFYASVSFNDTNEVTGAIERYSQVNRIDTLAFAGNDLDVFEMPSSITTIDGPETSSSDPANYRGIFGHMKPGAHHNYGIGDKEGSIIIKDSELFNKPLLWCKAIFGVTNNCTFEPENTGTLTQEEKDRALEECTTKWEERGYESEQECREDVSSWAVSEGQNTTYVCKYNGVTKYVTLVQ